MALKILCPCHNVDVTDKLSTVKELIESPNPEALTRCGLSRQEYNLLLPSAIASLTGQDRASAQKPREAFVREVLNHLQEAGELKDVEDMTHAAGHRFDFRAQTSGKRVVVVEVKGGEGNSVTLGGSGHQDVTSSLSGAISRVRSRNPPVNRPARSSGDLSRSW